MTPEQQTPASVVERYLLLKRGLYYGPNWCGYTGIKDHAGRYSEYEAKSHIGPVSGVTMVRESEAPDFTPECFDDLARAHLAKKLAEAAATIERQAAEIERLRDILLGIALSDRYRRYPKQHEDGGVRGQSGLRAVRALTGKHGSYLNDDEVVQLDKEARTALTGEDK
jgi:hypothetical protein